MMRKNIKWLKATLVSIVTIICIVSFFNYKVDNLGLFGNSNYLSQAAKSLTDGKMIAGFSNFDERLFQALVIKNLKVKNDVIAVGSSKSMLLRKRFFLDDKINFFNHSVSGASLEDYISIIGAYESMHGYIPQTVIFGVDPWVFNKFNNQSRWMSLDKYYNDQIEKVYNKKRSFNDVNIDKYFQLFNYDYTLSNIKTIKKAITSESDSFYITDKTDIDDSIREADGSIHYPFKIRYSDYESVKAAAIKSTKPPVYSLENFNSLDNVEIFEKFIKYLQGNGVKVVFFLPPYNPIAYDLLVQNSKYKIIEDVEEKLKQLADENDIKLLGSYNPHKYNFTNGDFYDGMHGNEMVTEKIFLDY